MNHTPHLWVPGAGLVPAHIRSAQKAVEEYDDRLTVARNEQSGDWVVLMRFPDGQQHIIFGLGFELPSPEKIKEQLWKRDVVRRGSQIVKETIEHNDRVQRRHREAAREADGELAEAMVWGQSQLGENPFPKIYVPKGVPK